MGNRFHDKRGGKVVKRYGQLPRHPRRVAGISAIVGDKATRSRGGNNPRISKSRKARAGEPRPAAARRRPTDSPTDGRCGKCPNKPTESMNYDKPHIGRQLSIMSVLSKAREPRRLGL